MKKIANLDSVVALVGTGLVLYVGLEFISKTTGFGIPFLPPGGMVPVPLPLPSPQPGTPTPPPAGGWDDYSDIPDEWLFGDLLNF